MKRLYTLLVIALIGFVGRAQIVNIPNPILKAKLLQANSSNGTASSQTPVYNSTSGSWYVTPYNSIDANGDGEIQVSEAQTIKWLALTNLDISDITGIEAFINLEYLGLSGNLLQNFNVGDLTRLRYLNVGHNNLQSLDVTGFSSLCHLWCYNNQLQNLFIKNNASWVSLGFDSNFDIKYVCADENDLTFVQNKIAQYGYTSCNVNSYCSFTPGGTFYTINGTNRRDLNNNGCDASDNPYPNLRLNLSIGTQQAGSIICNDQGNYYIGVSAGTYTLTPVLENSIYYTAANATVAFPTSTSPFNQNFCITPNGTHHDVEVIIVPIGPARPGFNASYDIVYKNKGTVIENGSIQFIFDDAVLDFVSADPLLSNQATNTLTWNYSDLQPLETRTIRLVLNVNSPTEIPPVNIDDQLGYQAIITASGSDEMQIDNTFGLKQNVVASYDPNDKTCLEGEIVAPGYIGNYVHYMIRFENTGTYPAENVVVKDIIDTAKFDVATLIPLKGSHPFVTRINNSNKVEFIFENIQLPFDDANNDGYVVFKIKIKPTLTVGSTFSNSANIYFDYNFPITTNTYTTTITALGTQDFEFSNLFTLSPVPTKDVLTITTKETVLISSVNIYNMLGQLLQISTNPTETVDVSGLKTGSYFIKIISDKGTTSSKFVKE
ncbi:T9SS type A sorting domain-containing protein [Flavobacterium sp. AS60]|uniref:DUF7619 domain-containing protein n=1 Tax=Flavobacterium anseongense TaxID=2910677 RepID=UPI001F1F0FCD|nr:T9SS type A sorting domain-containing protein [Flavobacterium sp. AS60]MCF6128513.1 T9SS type A sorting domain-containing protein [Flavobacterium sp. AS60]